MTTVQTKTKSRSYSIPAQKEQYEDEFHVSVRLSNRETKCYTCKNDDDWKDRVRRFVDKAQDEAECRVDTVTISHVVDGERVSQKKFRNQMKDGEQTFVPTSM